MRASTILMSLPFALAIILGAVAQEVVEDEALFGSWETEAPKASEQIGPVDVPPPVAVDEEVAESDVLSKPGSVPEQTLPDVPEGFDVALYATGMSQPGVIRVAPNGDIFVADSALGQVVVFASDAPAPADYEVYAEGLDRPMGIAFYPPDIPKFVYVASADKIVRYSYSEGDSKAGSAAEVVVADLPSDGHWTRDLVVAPDGERLLFSTGSASKGAETLTKKTAGEIEAHEKTYGMGAAWDIEEGRAMVRALNPVTGKITPYATGLRNCSGMAVQREMKTVWCTGNERGHGASEQQLPDYVTTITEGGFYGWPWYDTSGNEDPAHDGERPDLAGKVTAPDVMMRPNSSVAQLAFYEADAFPADYVGSAFLSLGGLDDRALQSGYRVVRVPMQDGKAAGEPKDFMTGFIDREGKIWGRPAGIAVTKDGSLLVSDDANGRIYRVTTAGPRRDK